MVVVVAAAGVRLSPSPLGLGARPIYFSVIMPGKVDTGMLISPFIFFNSGGLP